MTPQELKNSILQLAIQGKLVEQRDEEGTKIKDTLAQHQIVETDYSEELGFDIPDSWAWVALGEICNTIGGFAFKSTQYSNSGIRVIRISDFNEYGLINRDVKCYEKSDALSKYIIFSGDILMCMTGGTVGKSCYLTNIDEELYLNQRVACIRNDNKELLDTDYLNLIINSNVVKNIVNASKTSTNDNISMKLIQQFPVPLPPLEEQKHIVAKIEELLPYIDKYEKAWTKLEEFNKKFPDDMQKSILQMAIQGKLVEQRAEEGTAEELYKQIQVERQNVTKDGRKKKQEELPALTEEDYLFDIPESWKWVHLDELVTKDIRRGKSPKYNDNGSNTLVFAQKCNSKYDGIQLSLARCLDESTLSKYPNEENMRDGDIVINSTGGGTMGRVGYYRNEDNPSKRTVFPDSHVTVVRASNHISSEYIYTCLRYYQPYMESMGEGSTNQTELKPIVIRQLLIPLPPYEEQLRIVDAVKKTLLLCNRLK